MQNGTKVARLIENAVRDMAKPNNDKNHFYKNIEFVVFYYYYSTRELLNQFFQPCLKPANCTNTNCFFAFADQ